MARLLFSTKTLKKEKVREQKMQKMLRDELGISQKMSLNGWRKWKERADVQECLTRLENERENEKGSQSNARSLSGQGFENSQQLRLGPGRAGPSDQSPPPPQDRQSDSSVNAEGGAKTDEAKAAGGDVSSRSAGGVQSEIPSKSHENAPRQPSVQKSETQHHENGSDSESSFRGRSLEKIKWLVRYAEQFRNTNTDMLEHFLRANNLNHGEYRSVFGWLQSKGGADGEMRDHGSAKSRNAARGYDSSL